MKAAAIIALVAGLALLSSSESAALKLEQQFRPQYKRSNGTGPDFARQDQKLICYDGKRCSGNSVVIGTINVEDLGRSPYYFDNRAVSCRYNGIYLLYDGYNFNYNNLQGGVFAEAWGENKCVELNDFSYKASSVRFSGAPDGYKYDTLNLYEGEFYNGAETYFYDDENKVPHDNFGRSMIITGCSPWTLYEHQNYQGSRVCFYPSDTNNCYPSFFAYSSMLAGMSNRVSSVRRGCYAKKKMYGLPLQKSRLTSVGNYYNANE